MNKLNYGDYRELENITRTFEKSMEMLKEIPNPINLNKEQYESLKKQLGEKIDEGELNE